MIPIGDLRKKGEGAEENSKLRLEYSLYGKLFNVDDGF